MKYFYIIIFYILFLGTLSAQPSFEEIIKNYLEITGEKNAWSKLKSRVSTETYKIYSTSNHIEIVEQEMPYQIVYKAPFSYIKIWTMDGAWSSICFTNKAAWLYTNKNKSIIFLDDKNLKTKDDLPDITLLEIIDYPVYGAVTEENDLYLIKFLEKKFNRILSVYFNKKTGLITKHTYSNDGRDFHEYYYSDYRMVNGYMEPYLIENFVDQKRFKTIQVKDIVYNKNINAEIYKLPVSQKGRKTAILQNALSYPKIIEENNR